MRRHLRPVLFFALCTAASASAQYVATTYSGVPYPTLTSGVAIGLQAPGTSDPKDHGRADVQLGFTFPFYNRSYTQVTVTANGMLFLEPSSAANATADFPSNFAIPNAGAEPKGIIAPLWDDLWGKNTSSVVRRQAVSGPNGMGLAIEWSNWSEAFGVYDLNFQVRLWQNGLIDFYYGSMVGSGGSPTITCGIESPDGSKATLGKTCATDGGIAGASCGVSDFPGSENISFGPAPGPDISIGRLTVDSITPSAGNLNVATTLSLRNFGTQPTGAFHYRLYLSTDPAYQPGTDIELTPSPHPVASIAALSSTTDSVVTSVPRPATGNYYVLVVADSENEVTESNELNNVAINGVPLGNGIDLVAQSITGPPLGGPGDMVTNTISFANQGLDPAGSVKVRILLSLDTMIDATDRVVYEGNIPVAGGQNISQPVSYVLPSNVMAADYWFILVLDPDNTVTELDETNNSVVALNHFTAMQADLIIEDIRVERTTSPYPLATVAFFGEPIRLEATVKNQGGSSAPNVSVVFYLSDNDTLNGITDPFIVDVQGLSLASGASQTVTATALVPTRAVDMTPLAAGPYFFFAAAVGVGLAETTTTNNFIHAAPMRVRTPAPDLTPTLIQGPPAIGAGEQMVVSRTLTNIGNRPASGVRYRYYLSANTIVTPNDVPLKIKTDAGLVDESTVSLAVDAVDTATETVEVPATVTAATYYLGVLLDPDGAIDEVDHDNDGLAGQQIVVVGPGLSVDTAALPDAVLGRDYAVQLSGHGGDGTYTWSLAPGGMMPQGLTLSPMGVVSGVPTAEGAYAIALRVASGTRITDAVRVLRVVSPTSSVFIATQTLPSPAQRVDYEAHLAAGGGRAPYSWNIESGVLPQGLTLAADGTLSGQALQALGMQFSFVVRVHDSVGNTDARRFTVVIVDAASLTIATSVLPPAIVGTPYTVDINAKNGGTAPLSLPLSWSLAGGALPPGITLGRLDEKALLTGTATVQGVYTFSLEVVDARGRSDTASFVLEVQPPAVQVKATPAVPDQVVRGQMISVQFTVVGPAPDGLKWLVRDGTMPKGLTLDESGVLSGTVAGDTEFGDYTFTVAPTAQGQVVTFASYSMQAVEKINPKKACGCDAGEGGALALLAALLLRRRRR